MSEPETPQPCKSLPAFTPVPRAKDRSNGWKPHIQQAFIEALADTGSVAAACLMVRRSSHGAYNLRRQPGAEEFAAAWEAALDLGMQRIEDTAMDRALHGVEVPVYSYGKLVGSRTVHNDRLLMFMLRNRSPHRFADGRAKGMNAVDRMELARLKAKWRKEWQKEWGAEQLKQEVITIESINAKIDAMRAKSAQYESPAVRAAREALEDAKQRDREECYRPWHDPEHELYNPALKASPDRYGLYATDEEADAAGMDYNGPLALEAPEDGAEQEDERPRAPRIRTLLDGGWD